MAQTQGRPRRTKILYHNFSCFQQGKIIFRRKFPGVPDRSVVQNRFLRGLDLDRSRLRNELSETGFLTVGFVLVHRTGFDRLVERGILALQQIGRCRLVTGFHCGSEFLFESPQHISGRFVSETRLLALCECLYG